MVRITMTGKHEVRRAMNRQSPARTAMLEDLIAAAMNDAAQAEAASQAGWQLDGRNAAAGH
jgi:DNA-binding protein YbaB